MSKNDGVLDPFAITSWVVVVVASVFIGGCVSVPTAARGEITGESITLSGSNLE